MSLISKWARAIGLPALLVWPAATACGSTEESPFKAVSSAGTTAQAGATAAGGGTAEGGTTAQAGGAAQGGTTAQAGGAAQGGASDAGASAGGAGGSDDGAAGSGGSGDGGSAGAPALSERRVFVTSQTYVGGELGGVTGGDAE